MNILNAFAACGGDMSLLPEDNEVLIFGEDKTPEVGEIIPCEGGDYKITRSLGGPNYMSYGVLHED